MSMNLFFQAFAPKDLETMREDPSLVDGWVESEVKQIAPVKKTRARKPSPTKPAE